MNELYQTRFTTEEIIRTVFDAAYVDNGHGKGLTRLLSLFSGAANPAPSNIARPIPLRQATSLLMKSGMKRHTAMAIEKIVQDTMHEKMTGVYLLDKIKGTTDEFAAGVTMDDVDWSPRHFLGVSVGTPAVDFSRAPAMMTALKGHVRTALQDHMSDNPAAFTRQPVARRYDTAAAKRA